MPELSEEQILLNNIKTQIYQYVYRNTEVSFDSLIQFIQDISGYGNLNWQMTENKLLLISVFTKLQEQISNYIPENGDFSGYTHKALVTILEDVYLQPLLNMYMKKGYNTIPESIINSITTPYSTPQIQNSDFPDIPNTSHEFIPEVPATQLISKSLYTESSD